MSWWMCFTTVGDDGTSQCVSEDEMAEVRQELAAVRSEMEVDQLHSQLHYWQNATVKFLKDHYSSLDTSRYAHIIIYSNNYALAIHAHFKDAHDSYR